MVAERMSYLELLERYPRFGKRMGCYFTIFEPPKEEGLLSVTWLKNGSRVCPLCWHRLEECDVRKLRKGVMADYICQCGAIVREVIRARFVSDS